MDSIITPSALNIDFYNQINCLGPFGSGNSEPRFVVENLKVIKSKFVGNNHIKSLLIGSDGSVISTFTANAKETPLESLLIEGSKKKFNIAGKLKLNEWKGKKEIEFVIEDISC